jgi:hypothetical protein
MYIVSGVFVSMLVSNGEMWVQALVGQTKASPLSMHHLGERANTG